LAKQYHPDTNKDPAASKKFLEVQEAYEVLSDPEKKRSFDEFGSADPSATAYGSPRNGGGGQWDFKDFDLGDLFTGFGGGGSPFSRAFMGSDFGHEIRGLNIEVIH